MHVNSALIFSFLFASVTLADRTLEHRSRLLEGGELATVTNGPLYIGVPYRAGGVVQLDRGSIYNASAIFEVPTIERIHDANVLITVEIDDQSDPCSNTLGAGILISVSNASEPTYTAFYRKSNAPRLVTLSNFPISHGDIVKVVVSLSNETSGEVIINNFSRNGTTAKLPVTTDGPLCRQSAQWSIIGFPNYNPPAPSSYGVVTFTLPMVADVKGNVYGPESAMVIMDMTDDQGNTLTNATYDSNSMMVTPLA